MLKEGEYLTLKIKYDDFVEKFKPKKTTDDCYTPENIYNAILDWCVKEYGVNKADVVRPFYPGGDFENFDLYKENSVVIDNPPFSILSKIVGFYVHYGIKFFLFAPTLTLFSAASYRDYVCFLATGADIIYENGAVVPTSFVTNLEDKELQCRTTPDLRKILDNSILINIKGDKSGNLMIELVCEMDFERGIFNFQKSKWVTDIIW